MNSYICNEKTTVRLHRTKILYSRRTVSWVDVVSADVMHVYILVITSNQVNY